MCALVVGWRAFVLDARVDAKDAERCRRTLERAAREAARARAASGVLARCTIAFGEPMELQGVLGACARELGGFDVLALEPTSERAFASACANKHADVLSVRAGEKLPYKFSAANVKVALGNKISFELCYADALRDSTSRMWFFCNASALARATRGGRDFVILSSGAARAIELRSMHDIVNLATFFGMTEIAARAAMTTNVAEMLSLCKKRRDASATDSKVVDRMDAS